MRNCVAARDRVPSIYIKGHVRSDYQPLSGKRPPVLLGGSQLRDQISNQPYLTELQIRSRITKKSGQPEGETQRCHKISFI